MKNISNGTIILLCLYSLSLSVEPIGKIHFLNTHPTNAFLIESEGRYGLVDSSNNYLYSEHEVVKPFFDPDKGEHDKGTEHPERSVQRVVDYLHALKVDKLDFIIATHSHNDHIGGIPAIAYYFVDERTYYYYKQYRPTYEEKQTDWGNPAYFKAAYESMKVKGAKLIDTTDRQISFYLGKFKIELLSTETRECYDYGENCFCQTQLITIGNNRIFLEADLDKLEDIKIPGRVGIVDVFQVGHHGNYGSASYEFVKVISPKVAIIPNDKMSVDAEAKTVYMAHHFNTETYLTSGAGDEVDSCAIIVNFYEQGYKLENSGEKIDITKINGWKKWNDYEFYVVAGDFLIGWQDLEWDKGFDRFYFNEEGIELREWQKLDWEGGKQDTFYFDPDDGYMLHSTCREIEGVNYCFDENGVLIK